MEKDIENVSRQGEQGGNLPANLSQFFFQIDVNPRTLGLLEGGKPSPLKDRNWIGFSQELYAWVKRQLFPAITNTPSAGERGSVFEMLRRIDESIRSAPFWREELTEVLSLTSNALTRRALLGSNEDLVTASGAFIKYVNPLISRAGVILSPSPATAVLSKSLFDSICVATMSEAYQLSDGANSVEIFTIGEISSRLPIQVHGLFSLDSETSVVFPALSKILATQLGFYYQRMRSGSIVISSAFSLEPPHHQQVGLTAQATALTPHLANLEELGRIFCLRTVMEEGCHALDSLQLCRDSELETLPSDPLELNQMLIKSLLNENTFLSEVFRASDNEDPAFTASRNNGAIELHPDFITGANGPHPALICAKWVRDLAGWIASPIPGGVSNHEGGTGTNVASAVGVLALGSLYGRVPKGFAVDLADPTHLNHLLTVANQLVQLCYQHPDFARSLFRSAHREIFKYPKDTSILQFNKVHSF